jgi:hypothetical protein
MLFAPLRCCSAWSFTRQNRLGIVRSITGPFGDNSPSATLELFRYACHSVRLELFFLIAGFFAPLLWQRRGVWGFVRNRAGRILVPFVIGWLVL